MPVDNLVLEARHLGRRRPEGQGWLLADVSLTIPAGARVVVSGPSGSGKTLLLRALALLDPTDQGEVLWKGRMIPRAAIPAFRKRVLYLHQRAALLEDTVEAALCKPWTLGVHRHGRFDRQRVIDLLGQLGRSPAFLDQRGADLSGGEIQITALVRALQLEPNYLLLDEPTAALDPKAADAVENLLGRWLAERPAERALVWVTHDVDQAQHVGGMRVVMEGGRIVV